MISDFTLRLFLLVVILLQLQIGFLVWWIRNISQRVDYYRTALLQVQMNQVSELGQLIRIHHNSTNEEGC